MGKIAVVHIFRGALILLGAALSAACQSTPKPSPSAEPSRAELERKLSESQDLLNRYERRFGKLQASGPKHDFRKIRTQLKGKPSSAVVALLGKPDKVYTTGSSESWDYVDAAYDSASGRTVRRLEIWIRSGVVDYFNTSF